MNPIFQRVAGTVLSVYMSGCAIVSSESLRPGASEIYSVGFCATEPVIGYAGSTTLDSSLNDAFHGFKVGLRGKGSIDIVNDKTAHYFKIPTELSFRNLFGENRNFYEFGMSNGVRVLGNYDHSLEIIVSPARMGIESGGSKYWTPQAGLGYNLSPFQLQVGGDFYVGKEKGAGVFVNGGIRF